MRWSIGVKGRIDLEMAIIIALLVLVVVIIVSKKINKEIPQEEKLLVQRIEKREIADTEFPLSTPAAGVELPSEESEGERVIIEALRQRQMQHLKDDLKRSEEPTTITEHNIHPSEEDIKKMESEGVLLY